MTNRAGRLNAFLDVTPRVALSIGAPREAMLADYQADIALDDRNRALFRVATTQLRPGVVTDSVEITIDGEVRRQAVRRTDTDRGPQLEILGLEDKDFRSIARLVFTQRAYQAVNTRQIAKDIETIMRWDVNGFQKPSEVVEIVPRAPIANITQAARWQLIDVESEQTRRLMHNQWDRNVIDPTEGFWKLESNLTAATIEMESVLNALGFELSVATA